VDSDQCFKGAYCFHHYHPDDRDICSSDTSHNICRLHSENSRRKTSSNFILNTVKEAMRKKEKEKSKFT
jgi:myo-inositol catabolism protein IolC